VSAYLDRLFDEYRRAAQIGKDVMETAAAENRDLTAEEAEKRDRAFDAVSSLKSEIDRVQKFEQLSAAGDAVREAAEPIIERAVAGEKRVTDRELLLRGIDAVRSGNGFAFDSAFSQSTFSGGTMKTRAEFLADPTYEIRALSGNAGTAFANAFADFVAVYERTATPMLDPNIVTVLNRPTGAPLIVPRVTADPSTGGTITAEAAQINAGDLTLSQVTITPYKYAWMNYLSNEIDTDNTIGLEALVARTTGRALGLDIGTHLTTGSGSSQPKGFITAASNGGTASGTGTTYGTYFGGTDLISLYYKPQEPYRRVGTWMANATTLGQIRQSRDTTGQLLWQPSYQLGQPESLLGRPIYENPAMANGSAAKSVAFGDFSAYTVIRVGGVNVFMSPHFKADTDQLTIRTTERVGGDLPDVTAVYYLVNAAV